MFLCVNTHIITSQPLTENFTANRQTIYNSLKDGHSFIGLDYFENTTGFQYWAENHHQKYLMGDENLFVAPTALCIKSPVKANLRIVKDGAIIKTTCGKELTVITGQPGVYRVEAALPFRGRIFPWVYTNPIYLKAPASSQPPYVKKIAPELLKRAAADSGQPLQKIL